AEDGIRDFHVTGVQTCALPISPRAAAPRPEPVLQDRAILFAVVAEASHRRSASRRALHDHVVLHRAAEVVAGAGVARAARRLPRRLRAQRTMSIVEFPDAGKVSADFLEAVVYPRCGARRDEVRVGPAPGVDTAVIDLPNGYSIAMTTDPCSLIPALGLEESAWLTVHLLASDITTTGCPPMYALFDLNLPPDLSAADFAAYWSHVHAFCEALGCALVGGHTGRFEGQRSTIAGGGMMVTVARTADILPSGADRAAWRPRAPSPRHPISRYPGRKQATRGVRRTDVRWRRRMRSGTTPGALLSEQHGRRGARRRPGRSRRRGRDGDARRD